MRFDQFHVGYTVQLVDQQLVDQQLVEQQLVDLYCFHDSTVRVLCWDNITTRIDHPLKIQLALMSLWYFLSS